MAKKRTQGTYGGTWLAANEAQPRRRTIGERLAARFIKLENDVDGEPLAQVGTSTDGLFCFEDDRRMRARFVREARRDLAALIDGELADAQVHCTRCGTDVTELVRMREDNGRVWCLPCYHIERARADLSADLSDEAAAKSEAPEGA